ncbi:MAG: hypothetical protein EOO38_26315 [Cytophagaceae bacterium]|nr:MAG: hypothetical protein EOO38_26315 [Cytophagaceae bacterium]
MIPLIPGAPGYKDALTASNTLKKREAQVARQFATEATRPRRIEAVLTANYAAMDAARYRRIL